MRRLRRGLPCADWVSLALLVFEVDAAEVRRHDGIHRIEKAEISEVIVVRENLVKRDVTVCPTSHAACAASLGGGCCPGGYACATDSCYATTAAPQTCAGRANYWACAAEVGGGCCPYGLICGRGDQCSPPAGQTYSQSCPASYYLCPSSVGYGCCQTGMACAVSQCYSTAPSTFTVTQTVTTTPAGGDPITSVVTVTTTSTPPPPASLPTDPAQGVLKYYPSYVQKVQPVVSQTAENTGLTTPQIAGIVGGAAGFLIVVLVAAYIIIRHLNNVVRVVETSKHSSSESKNRPPMHQYRPSGSEVDALSVDPLMVSRRPSERRADSEAEAAWGFGSPGLSSGQQSTPNSYGYQVAQTSDSTPDRNASMDGGYFDVSPSGGLRQSQQSSAAPGTARVSIDSNGTYNHGRHFSNASEGNSDAGSVGARTPVVPELDATPVVPELPAFPSVAEIPVSSRRRSGGSSGGLTRPPHTRRGSNGHNRDRSDSSVTGAGPSGLAAVSETAEIHGYYGPRDRAVGQTAVGLDRLDSPQSM